MAQDAISHRGQLPALSFEVASVKVVPKDENIARELDGFWIAARDPAQIRVHHAYMWRLLTRAFHLQVDQLIGPSWVKVSDGDRYEIVAKTQPGASTDEIDAMMQDLLRERFHLSYHFEKRVLETYELVVAEGGSKLTKAEVPDELPVVPEGPMRKPLAKDGFPILPPGWPISMGASAHGQILTCSVPLMALMRFTPVLVLVISRSA